MEIWFQFKMETFPRFYMQFSGFFIVLLYMDCLCSDRTSHLANPAIFKQLMYKGRSRNKVPKEFQQHGKVRGEIRQQRCARLFPHSLFPRPRFAAHSFVAQQPSEMEVPIVDPAKIEIRSVIHFLHAKDTLPLDIHHQLTEVYGEKCMSVQHIRKRVSEFSTGRKEVHYEERSGRPSVSEAIIEMDLAPSDYHLFPKLKEHLGGQRLRRDDNIKEEMKRFLNGLVAEFCDRNRSTVNKNA